MGRKLLKNGFLIHGTGQAPEAQMDVLIEGNRIVKVGRNLDPHDGASADEPVQVIELNGKTIMPGMTEPHVHLTFDNTVYLQDVDMKSIEQSQMDAVKNAKILIHSGYTSAVSAAVRGRVDIALRNAIQRGEIVGPRLKANGPEVSSTGGFVDLMPTHIQQMVQGLSILADGADEIRRVVRSLLKEGQDVIKMNVSGDSFTQHARSEMTLYSYEEVKAACEEAHARGKRVYTHARSADSVKICVRAGVDIIGHADFIDDEAFELLVEQKDRIFVVPAFGNCIAVVEKGAQYFGQDAVDATEYKQGLEIAIPNLARLHKAGIRVLPGGDFGFAWNPHGAYAKDLEHFVNLLGMTEMEAIVSVTKHGGEIMEMGDRLGTIEEGKLADLLVVDGNPLNDIRVLQEHDRLRLIMKDGDYVKNTLSVQYREKQEQIA